MLQEGSTIVAAGRTDSSGDLSQGATSGSGSGARNESTGDELSYEEHLKIIDTVSKSP